MSGGAVTVGRLVVSVSGDVDQLAIDMREAQAITGKATKDIVNGLQGITEATSARNDAGRRMIASLQEEIKTFGMGADELKIYKAGLLGVGDQAAALVERLNSMKAAQAGFNDQVAASEASATARIRDMVAASVAEAAAMNDAAMASNGFATAQARLGSVTGSVAETVRAQNLNMSATTAAMRAAAAGTGELSAQTQAILNKYDPLGTKLRSLQSDMALLRREMGDSVDPAAMKAFQGLEEEITKTQGLMAKAGVEGFGKIEDGAKKSGFATAGATRELMVLGHEVVAGNFSRIPGSLMVLTSRAGGLGAMMEELAGTFGAIAFGATMVVGPLALAAAAAYQGRQDFLAMNTAIGLTSNYAGQTVDSINELAARIGAAGKMTSGAAREMVTSFVASGQIGGQALEKIALLAGNYAQQTGQSVEEITPKLIQLFSDPKQGAEELMKSMHLLTAENVEYIRALDDSGQHQQAQITLAEVLAGHLAVQAKEVGGLAGAWHDFANAMSTAWGIIKEHMSGTATPFQAQLQAAQAALDQMQGAPNLFGGDKELDKQIAKQKQYIADLIAGHKAEQDAAQASATAAAAAADKQNKITESLNQGQLHRINLLQQERDMLDGAANTPAVEARKLELDKQIESIQRSIGQEARQLTQQQITDQDQLALVKLKGVADDINNQYKLGNFTKEQFDIQMTRNALEANEEKQNYELRMAHVSGLTDVERRAHLDKLNLLKIERDQIEANGAAQIDIDDKKPMDDYLAALSKAGDAELKSLDAQIEKEHQHGLEIGNTREQVDALRAAQQQQKAVELQGQVDATEQMLSGLDPSDKTLDNARTIYTAWLAQAKADIEKIQALGQSQTENAGKEAAVKAAADLDKYLDPTKAQNFGNALKGSFDSASRSLMDLVRVMQTYGAQQARNDEARKNADIAYAKGNLTHAQYLDDINKLNDRNTKESLNSYANMAGAAAGFFDTGSRGYKALQTASEVMHAAELAMNLASIAPAMAAGAAQFFAQSGWGGFAGVAAMAAVIAGFGVAVSGGGSAPSAAARQASQGTGTILGDSNAKSDSISKSIELTAANSSTQINYLSGMLTSLQAIQTNIGSFASQIVQNTNISNPQVGNLAHGYGTTNLGAADMSMTGAEVGSYFGPIGTAVGAVVGYIASKIPVFQNIFTSIMGGKQSVADSGFTLDKTSLASVLSGGVNAKTYADITTSGGWFGKDKTSVQTTPLGDEANRQFGAVIKSLADSITQASTLLGACGDDFTAKLNSFVVDIGNVSLKGLSGDDQQKALEAVFSKLGDQMAQWAVDGLGQFAKVGEGYLQTLTRVATDYAKLDASLQSIGKTFGAVGIESVGAREGLISLMGGIDNLQSKTADFAQNFLTKGQQLAPVAAYVSQQLGAMNLGWVQTREQFASVVACLDLTTTSGQQTYASLMNLESAFAATHAAIVDTTKSEQEIADERKSLQDKLDALTLTSAQLHDKERATIDASNLALYDRVSALQAEKDAVQAAKDAMQAAKDVASGLMGDVDNAFTVLQNTMKPTTDALTARINAEKALSDAIKSTLSGMKAASTDLTDRAAAQAQIEAALAIAKAGGPLPTADSLKDALSTVSQDASTKFGSYADYLRDLYSTKNDLSQLGDLADSTLSVDQKQLDSLNAMLDAAKKQVDLLKGIDTTGLSIQQALAGFQTAIMAAKANPVVAATSAISDQYHQSLGRAPDAAGLAYWQQQAASGVPLGTITQSIAMSPEATIQGMYQSLLGRPADAAGLQFFLNSGASMADIASSLKDSGEYKKLHPFAIGTNFVPETMPALVHEGERIIPAADNRALMARLSSPSSNNDALLAELKASREENTRMRQMLESHLYAIAKNTRNTSDTLEGAAQGQRPLKTAAA